MFYLVCSNNALTVAASIPARAIKENHLFQVVERIEEKSKQAIYAEIDFKSLADLRAALEHDDAAAALGFGDDDAGRVGLLIGAIAAGVK